MNLIFGLNLILGFLSNSSRPSLILINRILDKNIRQNILPITLSALLYCQYFLSTTSEHFLKNLSVRTSNRYCPLRILVLPSSGVAFGDRGQCDEADDQDSDVELAIHVGFLVRSVQSALFRTTATVPGSPPAFILHRDPSASVHQIKRVIQHAVQCSSMQRVLLLSCVQTSITCIRKLLLAHESQPHAACVSHRSRRTPRSTRQCQCHKLRS